MVFQGFFKKNLLKKIDFFDGKMMGKCFENDWTLFGDMLGKHDWKHAWAIFGKCLETDRKMLGKNALEMFRSMLGELIGQMPGNCLEIDEATLGKHTWKNAGKMFGK